jgi:hypothetical protein
MTRNEFEVGARFFCGGHWWRCSDVGLRVIIAFRLDHEDDPTWYSGPPYAVAECVFDEYDQEGCFHTEQEAA